jgi:hypothetical protein
MWWLGIKISHFLSLMFVTLLSVALLPQTKKITANSYCSLPQLLPGAVGSRVHILFYKGFSAIIREDLGSTVSMERGCLQLEPQRRAPDFTVAAPSLQPCPSSLSPESDNVI